ncbi:MAG: hypothetical protein HY240_09905 [Actinobacteria bacterium]|nr:hypothetical protein [Actinomycetota bacterium]
MGVIAGDGTGPEVVREGLRVLEAVREGFETELVPFDLGAERYLRTGEVLPDEELEGLAGCDAIFLGAVGDPRVRPGILERDLLLRIRFELDQYVNLRPIVRYPGVPTLVPSQTADDVNFVVVRENSEGLYSGAGGFHRKGTPHEVAVQESVNTRHGVERIVRYAFDVARNRRRKLTLVHKTNVPIGGTAPDHTGKGTINPLAAIGAVQMMLAQLGEHEAATRAYEGIRFACSKMTSMRAGEMGYTTSEVGDLVIEGASST